MVVTFHGVFARNRAVLSSCGVVPASVILIGHGTVSCDNPIERHNLTMKGTSDFYGYVEIPVGKDMSRCVENVFDPPSVVDATPVNILPFLKRIKLE
jgi:hypothetical protein